MHFLTSVTSFIAISTTAGFVPSSLLSAPVRLSPLYETATDVTGTVKWYNTERGFGFIAVDDGSADMYVHATDLAINGPLMEDDRVSFVTEIDRRTNKPKAVNVVRRTDEQETPLASAEEPAVVESVAEQLNEAKMSVKAETFQRARLQFQLEQKARDDAAAADADVAAKVAEEAAAKEAEKKQLAEEATAAAAAAKAAVEEAAAKEAEEKRLAEAAAAAAAKVAADEAAAKKAEGKRLTEEAAAAAAAKAAAEEAAAKEAEEKRLAEETAAAAAAKAAAEKAAAKEAEEKRLAKEAAAAKVAAEEAAAKEAEEKRLAEAEAARIAEKEAEEATAKELGYPSAEIMRARQQPKSTEEEAALAAKYGAMELGEKIFAILTDLGMIDLHPDPDDPSRDTSTDDEDVECM